MDGHNRRGILVLGMHRSGTSAVTGILAKAGGSVPTDVMPATRDNPTGYWESQRIARFNNTLLLSAGTHWKDAGRINEGWFEAPERRADVARAAELVCAEFSDPGPFVCKDPRICRLLPIWRMALEMLGGEWMTLLVVRHPLAVASSLLKRMDDEQFRRAAVESLSSGILLWLRYVLDAERHSRSMPRTTVAYEAIIQDWKSAFAPVFSTGILAAPSPERVKRIDAFLTPALNREGHSSNLPDFANLPCGLAVAEAVRAALLENNSQLLDRIRAHLDQITESGEISTDEVMERLDRLEGVP